MAIDKLHAHREIWDRKSGLRKVYIHDFFDRIRNHMAPGGASLEVGGGPGFLKQHIPGLISSDVVSCPWHDLQCDAERIPFDAGSLDNVVGIDVLHHVPDPLRFLNDASRVLRKAGRLVLIEPWISPLGYLVNRFFMPEQLDLQWRPGESIAGNREGKRPFDGNPAVPFILFKREAKRLSEFIPSLELVELERFGFLAYLLSLGFRKASLLSEKTYDWVHAFETATRALWVGSCALKALIILERK